MFGAFACGTAASLSFLQPWQNPVSCDSASGKTQPWDFNGKTALVTGAGNGLGLAIARRLASAGAKVVLVDLNEKAVNEAAKELGSNAVSIPCDLRDLEGTQNKLKAAGVVDNVDLLVNCAGVAVFKSFFEISQETWDLTMDVNARAILFMSQLFAKGMVEKGGGSIVNISSQSSSVVVGPRHTCYSTSNAAVDHITRSTAINLAADNVRCNAVCPTVVRTELAIKAHGEAGLQKMADKIPVQRICQPDDVADVVLFLLSDSASMVTGVTLPVDGGFLAAR